MADTFAGNELPLTGATWLTAVPAPAAGQHVVGKLLIYNGDTVAHVCKWRKVKGATQLTMGQSNVGIGGIWTAITDATKVVLDDVDESIEVQSNAAATVDEPNFDAAWLVAT
jgi:hypothetical protein